VANVAGDKVGRRKMLIFTLVPYTLFTLLTAFSATKEMFTACQFLSRIFIIAELTLSNCTIVEEFDDDNRGWAIGMLGAISSTGLGLGLVMFGMVGGHSWGWRVMFLLGIMPLMALSWYRQLLPETRSYSAHSQNSVPAPMSLNSNPIHLLLHSYPRRFLYASAFVFSFQFCSNVAGLYNFKYLQEVYDFTPTQISLLGFFGGLVAVNMYTVAGSLSDKYGRKHLVMALSSAFFVMLIGFYNSAHWVGAVLLWVLFMSLEFGVSVIMSTYYSELFSTSHRSTAAGMYEVCSVIGLTVGTVTEAGLYSLTGNHWSAITYTSLPGIFVSLFLLWLPETAQLNLSLVSPEILLVVE
jgi:MFS family permease